MRPKGKLLALVAMFAAVGLITATGAFTTVEAERTAEVDVAGDANALLGISAADDVPDGAGEEVEGVFQLNLNEALGTGAAQGLNPDANTTLTPLVNVSNQGTNDVDVTVTAETDQTGVDVIVVDANGNSYDAQNVPSGQSTQFGLVIDLTGVTENNAPNFDIDITIEANESE